MFSQIIANLYAVHRDPNTFKDPNIFRPERFIATDGKFTKSPNVIPFSVGPRKCLGIQLAEMELFLFLTKIVQVFEIIPAEGAQVPSFEDYYMTFMFVPIPFKAHFKQRK